MNTNEPLAQGESVDFSPWEDVVRAAIEFAERFDGQYRPAIVQALLTSAVPAGPVARADTSQPKGEKSHGLNVTPIAHGGLAAVAKNLDVDPRDLGRIVDVDEDGTVRILARIDGNGKSVRANRYAAVYCYLKEKALGQLDTGIEELRDLCENHGCYDRPNFQRNFRNNDYVLEIGNRGTRIGKRYRLSPQGEAEARRILQELLS